MSQHRGLGDLKLTPAQERDALRRLVRRMLHVQHPDLGPLLTPGAVTIMGTELPADEEAALQNVLRTEG